MAILCFCPPESRQPFYHIHLANYKQTGVYSPPLIPSLFRFQKPLHSHGWYCLWLSPQFSPPLIPSHPRCLPNFLRLYSLISFFTIITFPSLGSSNLNKRAKTEDFPDPLGPASATFNPTSICKLKLRRTITSGRSG